MECISNFSTSEKKLKCKACASLKAKKLLLQLRDQQVIDMIVQTRAFDQQFAEIENLYRAGASVVASKNEIIKSHELFSAETTIEKDTVICRKDEEVLHYLSRDLLDEIEIIENADVDKSPIPSMTIVECDACGNGAHDITNCPLSPFHDAYAIEETDVKVSVNAMFDILSDFEFTDAIVCRDIVVGSPAEPAVDGEISPSTLDAFTLDRQLLDIYECEKEDKEKSSAFLTSSGAECRFISNEGYAFEWNILL
ncbi:hypothetical protein N7G274_004594 [Stereocaulon virgatum]|uniref:Uncharacterized protein n=1 Tax=Stereocaulon virgatum TaxID=373712 RepID=A0ABR4ABI3_9LECA